jgi:hypothetical protein
MKTTRETVSRLAWQVPDEQVRDELLELARNWMALSINKATVNQRRPRLIKDQARDHPRLHFGHQS